MLYANLENQTYSLGPHETLRPLAIDTVLPPSPAVTHALTTDPALRDHAEYNAGRHMPNPPVTLATALLTGSLTPLTALDQELHGVTLDAARAHADPR